MGNVIYIDHSGAERNIEVPSGQTLMEGAVINRVPGIVGHCGGQGGCATCHVYIVDEWLAAVGEISLKETRTLRFSYERKPCSRLACQLVMRDELDGIRVRTPVRQF